MGDADPNEVTEIAEDLAGSMAAVDFDEEVWGQVLGPQDIGAVLHVKDSGMMLVSTVAPDLDWESGTADVWFR